MSTTETDTEQSSNGAAGKRPERLPSGRHGLTREFVAHNQRERLLEAMSQAVAEKGYPDTTVADVLARAGVSRKTFYEHFKGREDCFLKTYEHAATGLLHRVGDAFESDSSEPWEIRARRGLTRLVDVIQREPVFARLCLVESLAAGPRALERHAAVVDSFREFIDEGRAEAPPELEISEATTQATVDGIAGVLYRKIASGQIAHLHNHLPELLYFALSPYVGRERARREAEAAREQSRS